MKVAIVQFPGSNCDYDTLHVLRDVIKVDADLVWHADLNETYDAVILPGGFSYGDYWRSGLVASFSPAIGVIKDMAKDGKNVLGICNGFQVLVEAKILPGALLPNTSGTFICKWVTVRVENTNSALTRGMANGSVLRLPIAHAEGRYYLSEEDTKKLVENEQIVFRYSNIEGEITEESNPNGSILNIAGVMNPEGNIVGMMPHPERASERILSPWGTEHGLRLLKNFVRRG